MRKDKPSRTAYKVAIGIVTLGEKPGMEQVLPNGVVESTAKLLVASKAAPPWAVRWSRSPRMVSVYEWFDWMLPGQFDAFAYRKAFIEHQTRTAIAKGAEQILVLGAGYDTLGMRLADEFPNVRFFEIDHPATSTLKQRGVCALGQPGNLHLIAEDLGERELAGVLQDAGEWDDRCQTLVVAEGLLMYLTREAVCGLFRQVASITGAESRFVFSYIPADKQGRHDAGRWTGLMLWLQKSVGEPWLWAISPGELGEFLRNLGWQIESDTEEGIEKHGVEFFVSARSITDRF